MSAGDPIRCHECDGLMVEQDSPGRCPHCDAFVVSPEAAERFAESMRLAGKRASEMCDRTLIDIIKRVVPGNGTGGD